MWKSLSLSYLEYNDLSKTIYDFINDIDKLRHLQATSHVPLVLSQKKESLFHVVLASDTLDVLSKIDAQFSKFNYKAVPSMIDFQAFEAYDLIMGNREVFMNKLFSGKKNFMEVDLI